MLFWAAGFVASDAQPYGLITGAWTTLRVAHNSTSPNNKLFSYNFCPYSTVRAVLREIKRRHYG